MSGWCSARSLSGWARGSGRRWQSWVPRVVIEPTTSWPEAGAVLAEAQQRMCLAGGDELAGYLAVVDVQGPDRDAESIASGAPARVAADARPGRGEGRGDGRPA